MKLLESRKLWFSIFPELKALNLDPVVLPKLNLLTGIFIKVLSNSLEQYMTEPYFFMHLHSCLYFLFSLRNIIDYKSNYQLIYSVFNNIDQ